MLFRSGTTYKGHDVWQCPPNGTGITMLVMLNILARFNLTEFAPLSVERFHLEAEATRIAYMMREQHIGDPDYTAIDVAGICPRTSPRIMPIRSKWTGCSIYPR